jgi:hypothetical protein
MNGPSPPLAWEWKNPEPRIDPGGHAKHSILSRDRKGVKMALRPSNADEKHVGGCGVGDLVARLPLAGCQTAGDQIACPTCHGRIPRNKQADRSVILCMRSFELEPRRRA